ncbi:DUF4276 family protein [Frankia sp. AgPm24]|uniref:DUF4276 family protein n=1 Tax=Frankia sp. AgPm24 TaxID=631128 RepID=UPI0020109300|nr:DUF4276 family protein [Frankia sp. AgPm24]MCK9924679.1 DUF4276 family protein [Frankia sp. AgPm24]
MSPPGPVIATVVEGEGEVTALPVLLRRLAYQLGYWTAHFPKPHRHHRGALVQPGGLERIIEQVAVLAPTAPAILVVFESWFLAAAPSLAGIRGLAADLKAHPDPENPRDYKGWLTHQRVDGQRYRPAVDQSALADVIDLAAARQNAPSFDKFCRDVEYLLTAATSHPPAGTSP